MLIQKIQNVLKIIYEYFKSNRRIPLFKKERSECKKYTMDEIYARYQPLVYIALLSGDDCYCGKTIYKKVIQLISLITALAAFSEAFPPLLNKVCKAA